jgi:hypothetical protein
MDVFVVLVYLAQPSLVAPAKDDSEDIRGKKTAERDVFVIDYFHLLAMAMYSIFVVLYSYQLQR